MARKGDIAKVSSIVVPAMAEPGGPTVSVVIPAWNEEKRLPATLEAYLPALEASCNSHEVIVVVDGSTDRTAEVASGYFRRGVRLLAFDRKLGKGGAVIEGFKSSRYEIVGFVDADTPVAPKDLSIMLEKLKGNDGVIASRWHKESIASRPPTASRLALSKSWNLLTRAVLGLDVLDTQCGAKFFRREAIATVLSKVTLTNWAFDASLLFHLNRSGFSFVEVPVHWNSDPNSKLLVERVAPAMFLSLLGVRLMSNPSFSTKMLPLAAWLRKQLG